jgi:hypothetical protein
MGQKRKGSKFFSFQSSREISEENTKNKIRGC